MTETFPACAALVVLVRVVTDWCRARRGGGVEARVTVHIALV
jgi:hypothetical protein